jgi:hypothetical protein
MPLTTKQGSPEEIGFSAERILSKDLGLPRNDDEKQYLCQDQANIPSKKEQRSRFKIDVEDARDEQE